VIKCDDHRDCQRQCAPSPPDRGPHLRRGVGEAGAQATALERDVASFVVEDSVGHLGQECVAAAVGERTVVAQRNNFRDGQDHELEP
jgi:hypothetical protein